MTRKIYIVFFALGLTACATQMPMDDAYYRPEKSVVPSSPAPDKRPEVEASPASPTMEILHQSDTTITVRIKK